MPRWRPWRLTAQDDTGGCRFIRQTQQDFSLLGARVQQVLFPPSIKDFVPHNHLAHFVLDLVRNNLDLSGILARYSELRGQPPYHPALMTSLLLYGYSRGIYSSRRIERAC